MSLLITLAIIGGLVGLYAVICFGIYVSAYVVALIDTFKFRVEKIVEAVKAKHEAKKEAKAVKKEIKAEIEDAKTELTEEKPAEEIVEKPETVETEKVEG